MVGVPTIQTMVDVGWLHSQGKPRQSEIHWLAETCYPHSLSYMTRFILLAAICGSQQAILNVETVWDSNLGEKDMITA